MPDDGPGADQQVHEHEVNELAKGLPGLPLEAGTVRVDEAGVHQPAAGKAPEVRIAWADVVRVGFVAKHKRLNVWGPHPEGGRPRPTVHIHATQDLLQKVEAAWHEYLLRRIERDGSLRGSVVMIRPVMEYVTAFWFGLLLMAFGGYMAYKSWGYAASHPGESEMVWGLRLVLWLFFGAGSLALVAGVSSLLRARTIKRCWSRWNFSRSGLAFREGIDERTLSPSPGDLLTPTKAVIEGRRVPLQDMTHRAVVAPLLLAMGERAEAECRAVDWLRPSALVTPAIVVGLIFLCWYALVRLGDPEGAARVLSLLPVLFALAGCALAYALYRGSKLALRKYLSSGRAMLERLGW